MTSSLAPDRDEGEITNTVEELVAQRKISLAARRALDEAAERRRAGASAPAEEEYGGRGGLEPTRYGDWESKGVASDF